MEYSFKTTEDFPTIKCVDMDDAETTASFARRENYAVIYTSDNTMLTKFKKKILANPDQWKVTRIYKMANGDVTGYEITCPKKYLRFITSETHKSMSDERKAKAAALMKEIHERRAQKKSFDE